MKSKPFCKAMLLGAMALMVGCAGFSSDDESDYQNVKAGKDSVVIANNEKIVIKNLDDAARVVALSLNDLAAISKTENPDMSRMPFTDIHDAELAKPIAISWYGPIAPALRKIGKTIQYRVQIFGKPPKTPILVNIGRDKAKTSAINLIRDADLQAGMNASVLLYPKERIISLRYTAT